MYCSQIYIYITLYKDRKKNHQKKEQFTNIIKNIHYNLQIDKEINRIQIDKYIGILNHILNIVWLKVCKKEDKKIRTLSLAFINVKIEKRNSPR